MTSQESPEAQNLLLLWDADFAPHYNFNKHLVQGLSGESPLSILCCNEYIKNKHSSLAPVGFDWRRMQSRYSKRKAMLSAARGLLNATISRQELPSIECIAPASVSVTTADQLLDRQKIAELRRYIFSLDSQELFALRCRDYWVGQHFCVDMSLDCKSISDDLRAGSPELVNLRLTAFYSWLLVEALNSLFNAQPILCYRLISTSVDSLDGVCRGYAAMRGHQHLFVEQTLSQSAGCKVYISSSHDLLLRRQYQAALDYSGQLLSEAIDFALEYLKRRFSLGSSHTYSPLTTAAIELARLGDLICANPSLPVWIYFTNSPDELVSISHDYRCTGIASLIPWDDSGVVQDEVQALRLVAKIAQEQNALLVIRQHPRLGPESRCSFLSSEYRLLADCCAELAQLYPGRILSFQPWSLINSYELALLSDRVISFRGTMPLEVSLLGLRPLVLAFNKGCMNFAIQLHADHAPRTLDDLRIDLESRSSCYSFKEIAAFLIQFYLVRSIGVIPLGESRESLDSLSQALYSGTSLQSLSLAQCRPLSSLPVVTRQEASKQGHYSLASLPQNILSVLESFDHDTMIASYLERAYAVAAFSFGLSSDMMEK